MKLEPNLLANTANEEPVVFSVSQISNNLKLLIEEKFYFVKIRGEISGFKLATSGHAYFNLKDQQAILACTCWRPVMSNIKFEFQDGIEVLASGKLTIYGGQSRYQLTVTQVEPYGLGSLMLILSRRRAALEAEGLFAIEHKKPLPFLPTVVGVVTSKAGVVIRDIIHRIEDRCPTRVIIWPVTVQGDKAADEIAAAIKGFNNLSNDLRPQVIIVARGGGSIEDLWAFNEEQVVRATAASAIPIISAVGHETDNTLIDLAADRRAPTPTAAAEFAVPVARILLTDLEDALYMLKTKASRCLAVINNSLQLLVYRFNKIADLLINLEQSLDLTSLKFTGLSKFSQFNTTRFAIAQAYNFNPLRFLESLAIKLMQMTIYLNKKALDYLQIKHHRLEIWQLKIDKADVATALSQGLAIITDNHGQLLNSVNKIAIGQQVSMKLRDGYCQAIVTDIRANIGLN